MSKTSEPMRHARRRKGWRVTRDSALLFGFTAGRVYVWDEPVGWQLKLGLGRTVIAYMTRGAR